MATKISKILKLISKEEFFTLKEINYRKIYADIKMAVNISSLRRATYFCYRKAPDRENDLQKFGEDNVTFYAYKEAILTGTLNQFGDKPMGCSFIAKEISVINKIKNGKNLGIPANFVSCLLAE